MIDTFKHIFFESFQSFWEKTPQQVFAFCMHVCSIVSFHIYLAQLFQIICHICSFKRHCIPSLKHFLGPDISLEDSFTHIFCILKVSPCSVYLPHLSQVQSSSLAIYSQTSCGGRRTWAWPVLSRAPSWSKNLIWNTLPGFPVTTFYNSWDGRKLYGFWMLLYNICTVYFDIYIYVYIYTYITSVPFWHWEAISFCRHSAPEFDASSWAAGLRFACSAVCTEAVSAVISRQKPLEANSAFWEFG